MRRLVIAAVVVGILAVAGAKLWQTLSTSFSDLLGTSPQCLATANGVSFGRDPEQTEYAGLIAAVGIRRGLPPRAITIAIATAIQESKLRNLSVGDRDSLGLFQQRPSQGWGTADQIMNPVYATNAFYDHLIRIPGYQTMDITQAAQEVQHSAYPEAYAQHEQDARAFASALTGNSPHGLTCQIDAPTTSDPTSAAAEIAKFYGAFAGAPIAHGASTTYPITGSDTDGWAVAEYLVAQAGRLGALQVSYDGWSWTPKHDWQQTDVGKAGVVAVFAG